MNGAPRLEVLEESAHKLLSLAAARPERYPFLLQSVASGTARGRFDILFAFPQECLILQNNGNLVGSDNGLIAQGDFLDAFDSWRKQEGHSADSITDTPFRGGWFVFLAYELAMQIERHLRLPGHDDLLPVAYACRIPAAIIFDHSRNMLTLVAESGAEDYCRQMRQDLAEVSTLPDTDPILVQSLTEDDPARYLQSVKRIKHYINEGDVFQVNLSRAWDIRLQQAVADTVLYQQLCRTNPAPFAGLARIAGSSIISSSPERLISVRDGWIETRPIAGTRPRGEREVSDQNLKRELMSHPKERSEHIMLIDLERNDLGRVCRPGTVQVDELMGLESYMHVHHIVSNIRGRLREGVTSGEIVRAVFPGGTITGCPKVRCMEIIAELEQTPRGAYTGSMGYINRDGSMDLNILIRTMIQRGDRLQLRAGAGIVADSIPEKELDETRAKAKGVLAALEQTGTGR